MLRTTCFVLALAGAVANAQPRYEASIIGGMPQGPGFGPVSLPLALNNNGRVVGYSYTSAGSTRAMNWKSGSLYALGGVSGYGATYANHVNLLGRVAGAGTVLDASGQIVGTRALKWTGGTLSDLGTLGGHHAAALSINDSDQIVGYATLAGDAQIRAFIYQNGVMSMIAMYAGTTESYAYDISNTGFVVGTCVAGTPAKPFMWRGGVFQPLPIPVYARTGAANAVNDAGVAAGCWEANQYTGSFVACLWYGPQRLDLPNLGGPVAYAVASDINVLGQVVGTSGSAAGYTGFLYQNGRMYDLRDLMTTPLLITSAHSINDVGQIAAGAIINGHETAVLLTPVGGTAGPSMQGN